MPQAKKEHPKEKSRLHPRNKHRERYDFKLLIETCPELAEFVRLNDYQDESIDFFDPAAVKMLNKALLKQYYGVDHWDIPPGYLCPPIPGRADYIHHIADLIYAERPDKEMPVNKIKCLDIGVGANCVYPIIGSVSYGWKFTGADIDPNAIASAKAIIEANPLLKDKIDLRLQSNPKDIFRGIIQDGDFFDLTICNPPFHASVAEAQAGTMRKLRNLKQGKSAKPVLNFGGQHNELWCDGGEERFVRDMIFQSRQFAASCLWFSTLISKESNLTSVYRTLKKTGAVAVKTIPMGQGNKSSRIVAWTFLPADKQAQWMQERWK